MNDDTNSRGQLAPNLAREWVTEQVGEEGAVASIQSEWLSEGIPFPQTSGEHEDPTGIKPPDWIGVKVTVPASTNDERIEALTQRIKEASEGDRSLGSRVGAAHFMDDEPQIAEVEHQDYGPAKEITYRFSVRDPLGPAGFQDKGPLDQARGR